MQHYLNERYMRPLSSIRRVIGMFIPQRYRRCRVCDEPFADGLLFVDNGYLHGAICSGCYEKACSGELAPELVDEIENAFRS